MMIIIKETTKAGKLIGFLATIATEDNGVRHRKRSIHTEEESNKEKKQTFGYQRKS